MIKDRTYLAFLAAAFLAALLFSTCNSGEIEELEIDFGYEYYPLAIGHSWTYQVDSVLYQPGLRGVTKDSSRSFLRETIVDTTTSLTGELLYIVERYYRANEESPWQIAKVFTRSRSKEQAFQTEDNLTFVKMPFPLERGKRWNGHVYFDVNRLFPVGGEFLVVFLDWEYSVTEIKTSFEEYDDVATIQQANYTESAINARVAQEKYARDIGLIYREWFIADSQCDYCCGGNQGSECQATPWEERAEKGFYLKQTLISYH